MLKNQQNLLLYEQRPAEKKKKRKKNVLHRRMMSSRRRGRKQQRKYWRPYQSSTRIYACISSYAVAALIAFGVYSIPVFLRAAITVSVVVIIVVATDVTLLHHQMNVVHGFHHSCDMCFGNASIYRMLNGVWCYSGHGQKWRNFSPEATVCALSRVIRVTFKLALHVRCKHFRSCNFPLAGKCEIRKPSTYIYHNFIVSTDALPWQRQYKNASNAEEFQ